MATTDTRRHSQKHSHALRHSHTHTHLVIAGVLVLVQVLQDRLVDRLVLVDALQLARDLLLPPFAQVMSQQVVVGDLPQADQPSLGRIWRCAVDAASQYWTQLPCINAVLGSLSLFLMRE